MTTDLRGMFRRARKHKEVRQEFLDAVDFGDFSQYVNRAVYAERGRLIDRILQLTTSFKVIMSVNSSVIPHCKSNIYVYPLAFSDGYCSNLDDFLNILIDHEGFHAKQNYERTIADKLKLISPFVSLRQFKQKRREIELSAYDYQLEKSKSRKCSKDHLNNVQLIRQVYEGY